MLILPRTKLVTKTNKNDDAMNNLKAFFEKEVVLFGWCFCGAKF